MRKRVKLISLILGIMLLLGVFGVGVAMAADPTPTPTTAADYQQLFLSKVAAILGVSEQKLTDALAQARKEVENQMIDDAVAAGRMTQEYADWLKQRPQQSGDDFGFGFGVKGGRLGGRMHGGFGLPGKVLPMPTPTTK